MKTALMCVALLGLAGCTVTQAPMDDAIRQCKESLPAGNYRVLETARVGNGFLFHVTESRRPGDRIPEYLLPGYPGNGPPGSVRLVLLQRQPDELVYCKVTSDWCEPDRVWMKRAKNQSGGTDWVVQPPEGLDSVCRMP